MRVSDIMTQGIEVCRPETDLASAAKLMWDGDCGILPVVEDGRLAGVVTDRDICMGLAMRERLAGEIEVREVMSAPAHVTLPEAEVAEALDIMTRHQVRRLPVVGRDGEIEGILSMNDIVLEAKAKRSKAGGPSHKDVIVALQEIGRHRELPVLA